MAEGPGLENRYTGNGIVGSNPTLSVTQKHEWHEWHGRHGSTLVLLVLLVPSRAPLKFGQVAERLKALAWKACKRETVSRVRIPPCPWDAGPIIDRSGICLL